MFDESTSVDKVGTTDQLVNPVVPSAASTSAAASSLMRDVSTDTSTPPVLNEALQMPPPPPAVSLNTSVNSGNVFQSSPSLVTIASAIPLYPGINSSDKSTTPGTGNLCSRYNQLLSVIKEMSRDLKPVYSGSKTSLDRFKRGIAQAKLLTRECSYEVDVRINGNKSANSKLTAQATSVNNQSPGCK